MESSWIASPYMIYNKHVLVHLTLSPSVSSPSSFLLQKSQTRDELQQLTEDVVEEIAVVVIGFKSLLQRWPSLQEQLSTVCSVSSTREFTGSSINRTVNSHSGRGSAAETLQQIFNQDIHQHHSENLALCHYCARQKG